MQVARLERAVELLGGQIEAGKATAAAAYLRTVEALSKLVARPLRLDDPLFREQGAVAKMTERLARLDAAREIVAARALAAQAKQNAGQAIEKTESGETAIAPRLRNPDPSGRKRSSSFRLPFASFRLASPASRPSPGGRGAGVRGSTAANPR